STGASRARTPYLICSIRFSWSQRSLESNTIYAAKDFRSRRRYSILFCRLERRLERRRSISRRRISCCALLTPNALSAGYERIIDKRQICTRMSSSSYATYQLVTEQREGHACLGIRSKHLRLVQGVSYEQSRITGSVSPIPFELRT